MGERDQRRCDTESVADSSMVLCRTSGQRDGCTSCNNISHKLSMTKTAPQPPVRLGPPRRGTSPASLPMLYHGATPCIVQSASVIDRTKLTGSGSVTGCEP